MRGRIAHFLTLVLLFAVGCDEQSMSEQERELQLYQNWELQPGDVVAGYPVASGLGDISIALNGNAVYAPFNGRVQPNKTGCAIFSSEEVPSYLFRLCGLKSYRFGVRRAGEVIGKGNELHFAVLNQQADGQWAMVEPSKKILEQILQPQ
ncbi:MAG: hypothetical protein LDL41_17010 [Coleofasciculus sp. S288]|nr:hypothetical protein [Coleofasciculus sp. S288]